MNQSDRDAKGSALVTGANSGVGLETAYQLAAIGYRKVILSCRTHARCAAARQQLLERGAPDVFEALEVDVSEVPSAAKAGAELLQRGPALDLVILNAGTAGGSTVVRNSKGVDLTFASTLMGHHALTTSLLNGGGITEHGRIIIAGSEAARGDVLGMTIPDLDALARKDFAGSVYDLLEALARASYPAPYVASTAYALAKLCAAWWAAELSRRLPKAMAVYAVSPGNTPSTNMGRNLPWFVRKIALPVLDSIGPLAGMAHPVATASQRYLDASRFGSEQSGKFFASPAKKLTGAMVEQRTQWLQDLDKQSVAYALIVEMTGGLDYRDASPEAPLAQQRSSRGRLCANG